MPITKTKISVLSEPSNNVRNGYSFINCNDTREDNFVHQTAVTWNNPYKNKWSVGESEIVEFDVVVGKK